MRKFYVKFYVNKILYCMNYEVKSVILFFMIKRLLFLIGFNLLFGCCGFGVILCEVLFLRVVIIGVMLYGMRNN